LNVSHRSKCLIGIGLVVLLGAGTLVWCLRQPPSIVVKIESFGGTVHSRYLPTTFPFAEPLGFRRLESPYDVTIDSDQFTDRDLIRLVAYDTVTELEIRSASITDKSLAVLAESRQIKSDPRAPWPDPLSGFRLDCPQVTDAGLALCQKIGNRDLTVVAGPHVKGTFMKQLRDSRTLQFLALHGKTIGDDVVDDICRLPKTENVDLRGTSVSDASIEKFAEMMHLVRLDLRDTAVTAEGVEKLKRTLRHRVVVLSDSNVKPRQNE
jgi:hypothetical protein